MYRKPNSRRQFLTGAGGFLLSLPLLPSLLPKAHAAGGRERRFIYVFHGNGTDAPNFFPNNLQMTNMNGGQRGILTSRQGALSTIIDSSFDSLKSKMNIIHGLDRDKMESNYHGHNPMACLAGCNMVDGNGGNFSGRYVGRHSAWNSLDQVMANSSIIYPNNPVARDIHLMSRRRGAGNPRDRRSAVSFRAVGGQFVDNLPERDPRVIFDRYFGGNTQPPSQQQDLSQRHQKVVDKVLEDYRSLRGSRKISSADRVALDIHIEHLNQLETNLVSIAPTQCEALSRPGGNQIDFRNRTEADNYYTNHIDLIVALVRCNITNVITFMLNGPTDEEPFSFISGYRGNSFHFESHFGEDGPSNKSAHYTEIYRYLAGKVAELGNKLDTPEGGGATYLDNSLVMNTSCQGLGNHTGGNIPTILLGSAGGAIRTNQYLRLSGAPAYNQLLVTAAQAMGLSPADYNQGGRRGFGSYRNQNEASDSPLSGVLI